MGAATSVAVPQRRNPRPSLGRKLPHTRYDRFQTKGVTVEDDGQSDVSGLTDLDFSYRKNKTHNRLKKNEKEVEDDDFLEAAFHDSEDKLTKDKRQQVGEQEYGREISREHSVSRRTSGEKS